MLYCPHLRSQASPSQAPGSSLTCLKEPLAPTFLCLLPTLHPVPSACLVALGLSETFLRLLLPGEDVSTEPTVCPGAELREPSRPLGRQQWGLSEGPFRSWGSSMEVGRGREPRELASLGVGI